MFSDRRLFTLPRPSKTDSTQRLDAKHSNINSKFLQGVAELKELILDSATPVAVNNVPMTGSVFVKFCEKLVETVQTNAVPKLQDTWTMMATIQHQELVNDITNDARTTVDEWPNADASTMKNKFEALIMECVALFASKAASPAPSSEDAEALLRPLISKATEARRREKPSTYESWLGRPSAQWKPS